MGIERWVRAMRMRVRAVFAREAVDRELDDELAYHVAMKTEENITRGMSAAEARRAALIDAGGVEQAKEKCRDARGVKWLQDLAQDLRFGLRMLRKNLGFTVVALLTIGLGIGATTAMFTVVNGVLLRPLSYPESDRLLTLHEQSGRQGEWQLSYPNFIDCQRDSQSLTLAAWRFGRGVLSEPGAAEYVVSRQVSANLFSVLGVSLSHGRAFLPDEDRPGGTPVAIISPRLWQAHYAGRPEAIGERLVFDGRSYAVIGIAPVGFSLSGDADIFTPLGQNTSPPMQNREMHPGIHALARLQARVTIAQANAELGMIARRLAQEYPKSNADRMIAAEPLRDDIVGDVKPTLWLLLGAVSLVLLVACINVASLLLARALSRDRELAMRVALGAGRGRLVRQCLTESLVLAFGGCTLGVAFASVGTRQLLNFWPGGLPRAEDVRVDLHVLGFAIGAAVLSGIFFGIAPALRAPAANLDNALRSGTRTTTRVARRLHGAFVVSEIAIAFVLLASAGILGRTLFRTLAVDPGINPHHVLVTDVALSPEALATSAGTRAAWSSVVGRVSGIPGVDSVAIADIVPMSGDTEEIGYWTTATEPAIDQMPLALLNLVTPEYPRAMGIMLLRGRFFEDNDRLGNEPVIVIDDVMAQRVFGDQDAIGKQLSLQIIGAAQVIGVVRHVRHWGLDADDQAKVREQIYVPFAQLPDAFVRLTSGMSLVIRTTAPPSDVEEAVKREVRGATPDQVASRLRTMDEIVSGTLTRQRFLLILFAAFATLALSLACIGIYGVLAYLTGQRVPEIGVRMALGASAHRVMWMVLRQSLAMIFLGLSVGLGAAIGAGRLLRGFVVGMQSMEPSTMVVMAAVMVGAALAASFVPARRAMRVDPMVALRHE